MGTAFLFLGLIVIVGILLFWQLPNLRRRFFVSQVDKGFVRTIAPQYQQVETPLELTSEEKLLHAHVGQFIEELGQKSPILGVIALDEQMETGGSTGSDWSSTGRMYQILQLAHTRLIARLPQGDSGDETWFSFLPKTGTHADTAFFAGTDSEPGPARQFSDSELRRTIQFSLMDKTWEMIGIPQYNFTGRGQAFAFGSGTLRGVLAKEVDGNVWLLYVDVFAGRGHDGLYLGQVIDPSVDIDDVL